jgi:sugar phosphate permease
MVAIPPAVRFPAAQQQPLLAQLRGGAKCLWGTPSLRLMLLVSLPPMATLGIVLALTPPFVSDDLKMGADVLGLLNGLFSAGVVVAGFSVVKMREKIDLRMLLGGGAILFGLAFLPLLGKATLLIAGVLWLISGAGRGAISALAQVTFALETPVDLRGRVFALSNATTMAARMIGSLVAGAVAEVVGIRATLAVGGVIAAVSALVLIAVAAERGSAPELESSGRTRSETR